MIGRADEEEQLWGCALILHSMVFSLDQSRLSGRVICYTVVPGSGNFQLFNLMYYGLG